MLPILAMPTTTVPKMIGASSILMSLMKPSATGCRWTPMSGQNWPMSPPMTMAINTCT